MTSPQPGGEFHLATDGEFQLAMDNALAGVIDDKDAAKGILVTTSWFGKASYDFARRNGRIQLIDGRGLKSMLRDHLNKEILIGLPSTPRGWTRDDVA